MLVELIREHALADAQAGQWSTVATILNAANITQRDTTPLTYSRIRVALGEEIRQKVAGTMRTIGVSAHPLAGEIRDAHSVMLIEAGGIDISTDDRQALIDLVATAGGWSVEESAAVKALGVRLVSLAGEVATAEQCEDAWALSLKQTALTRCTEAMEAAQAEYRSADSTPATIVQAMLDSLGAV